MSHARTESMFPKLLWQIVCPMETKRKRRDSRGRIIATIDDYTVVRQLVADLVSEGVGATVPSIVRETVHAVAAAAQEDGISLTVLAQALLPPPSQNRSVGETRRRRRGRCAPVAWRVL